MYSNFLENPTSLPTLTAEHHRPKVYATPLWILIVGSWRMLTCDRCILANPFLSKISVTSRFRSGNFCNISFQSRHTFAVQPPKKNQREQRYMKDNPRINQQERDKIMFHGSAYPKEISQQCTTTTCKEAVHHQGVLMGSSIPISDH